MKLCKKWLAGLTVASLAFAAPAAAQDEGSMQAGKAKVSVGGGTAILTLPDVDSFLTLNALILGNNRVLDSFKFTDDFGDEIGWNVNASIEAPIGVGKTLSLNGFWANIDDKDTARCDHSATTQCVINSLVDAPGINNNNGTLAGESIVSSAERDVDQWGVSLEAKRQLYPGISGVTQAPPRRYVSLGADVRGIDQDLDVDLRFLNAPAGIGPVTYSEDLDTRYYGAYAAWGGDVRPFLFKGMWERLGLQSSFQLRGGIYYADTDYSGRIVDPTQGIGLGPNSSLNLSDDDVAFIGGLVLETKKRIGHRATLSLKSEYEYYSYVPDMAYNQVDVSATRPGGQVGTVINDDDAFSLRSSLRLTIGLGGRDLYKDAAYK